MKRHFLFFTAPRTVALREEPAPTPGAGQALVETLCSAVSSGTELLIYRGEAPAEMAADATLPALKGTLKFPLKYGYSAVGRVLEVGKGVEIAEWQGRLVFAFNPHETLFTANIAELIPLPPNADPEAAALLSNVETALNFLHDGRPLVGERVAVFGQGIVGLLTTALLARLPLADLLTFDLYPLRRTLSLEAGARASPDPREAPPVADFDLCYELSGSPEALNSAIGLTGFGGRLVIGSWYGIKRASLDLGGHFHRSRLQLISSQVSSLAPELTGRWTRARRRQTALELLGELRPARFITHRLPFTQAAEAYKLLDQSPGAAVQIILTYP